MAICLTFTCGINGKALFEKNSPTDSFENWNDPPNKHAVVARQVVHKSGKYISVALFTEKQSINGT